MFRFTVRDVWVGSQVRRFQIVDHPGGSAVWAEQEGKILLVEQYRPAARRSMLEVPAGTLELGEDPKTTAFREFEEETGYKAVDLEPIGHLYLSPGYTTEKMHLFRATALEPGVQNLDPGEDVKVRWIALEDLKTMVREGNIHDAKTLVAFYHCTQSL